MRPRLVSLEFLEPLQVADRIGRVQPQLYSNGNVKQRPLRLRNRPQSSLVHSSSLDGPHYPIQSSNNITPLQSSPGNPGGNSQPPPPRVHHRLSLDARRENEVSWPLARSPSIHSARDHTTWNNADAVPPAAAVSAVPVIARRSEMTTSASCGSILDHHHNHHHHYPPHRVAVTATTVAAAAAAAAPFQPPPPSYSKQSLSDSGAFLDRQSSQSETQLAEAATTTATTAVAMAATAISGTSTTRSFTFSSRRLIPPPSAAATSVASGDRRVAVSGATSTGRSGRPSLIGIASASNTSSLDDCRVSPDTESDESGLGQNESMRPGRLLPKQLSRSYNSVVRYSAFAADQSSTAANRGTRKPNKFCSWV